MQNPDSGLSVSVENQPIPKIIQASTSEPVSFVPPPPRLGAIPLPPPGLVFSLPMATQGEIRPKTDPDASLSPEELGIKVIRLIKEKKAAMDNLIEQEINLTLSPNKPADFQKQLELLVDKIKQENQPLSLISKNYSKSITGILKHEKTLKDGSADLAQIQKSLDDSLPFITLVIAEVHQIFPDNEQSQETEEALNKALENLKELLQATRETIEDSNKSILTLQESINQARQQDTAGVHPARLARRRAKEATLEKQRPKALSDLEVFKKEEARLIKLISETIPALRFKTIKSCILNGVNSSHSALKQMIQTAKDKKEASGKTIPAQASKSTKKISRSAREEELIAFIKGGLIKHGSEEQTNTPPERNIISGRLLGKILNLGADNLVYIRDQYPEMFNGSTYDAPKIAEELSIKLLNYCVPLTIGSGSGSMALVIKSPLPNGVEFREMIESLWEKDFITGESIPEEQLQKYYPAAACSALILSNTKAFCPKNLRPPKTNDLTKPGAKP